MALISRVCTGKHSLNGLFNRLCKVSKYNNMQVAHISGRLNRISRPRPPPFPYRTKELGALDALFDYNVERFDENSRIIVVEGPIAAGKDKFARELAKQLDMGYMEAPTFDWCCKDGYGFDIRTVDRTLPEKMQICDVERFLSNPKHANLAPLPIQFYMLKLEAYVESLLHILSTGEGVVVNRSLFSNFVFMKAMYNAGYISKRVRRFYEKAVSEAEVCIMRPHLVIYLDIPVNVVEDRIKERCIPYEVNSKVLTTKYLTDIENIYKNEFLPQIKDHAYLLMYDWVCEGDIGDVVEDIERINMEYNKQYPEKLQDWVFGTTADLMGRRKLYSREDRHHILMKVMIPDFEVTEMFLFGNDIEKQEELYVKHQAKYQPGYNPQKGDSVLWKSKIDIDALCQRVITNKELLTTE